MGRTQLVLFALGAVALVALAVFTVTYLRRRRVVFHDRAVELREHAAFQSERLPDLELEARDARVEADKARHHAARLEEEAQERESALERARSRVEGTVREADRIDPEVRHRAQDYSPALPTEDEPDPADAPVPEAPSGPTHRASGPSSRSLG